MGAVDAIDKAGGASEQPFVVILTENSTEVEQELKMRISAARENSGNVTPDPSVTYVGIFAGSEKPKPFQRKRASLIITGNDALPTPQAMRRMSMQAVRQRQAGMRTALALQHIHEGQNYFKIKMSDGVKRYMVVNYDCVSVVIDPQQGSLSQVGGRGIV